MKKRTVIWLLVASVVLIAVYALVMNWGALMERFFPTEYGPYQGDGTTKVFEIESVENITRLDWTVDGKEYSIRRNEAGDFVCDQEEMELDQEKISADILNALTDFRASHVLEGVDPADYGLAEPYLEFTVYDSGPDSKNPLPGDGNKNTVKVGLHNTVTDTNYAIMPDGRICLLLSKLPSRLTNYDDYAMKQTAPDDATATYVRIETGGESYEYYSSDGNSNDFYSVVFSWYTVLPDGTKQPVLIDILDPIYKLFTEKEWSARVADDPEDLSVYGLEDPAFRLTFRYLYSETGTDMSGAPTMEQKEDEYVLLIGASADEENTYAMEGGSNVVRTIANEKLTELMGFAPDKMYMHFAVVPEWQTIQQIDITLADGTSLTCQIGKDEAGKATYFIEGVQVEKEDVRSVFLSLYNPAIDGIDPEANRDRADAVVTARFLRDRESYSDMTLYLIPYNSTYYVVDFAGQQQYLVSKRVIDGINEAVAEALALIQ